MHSFEKVGGSDIVLTISIKGEISLYPPIVDSLLEVLSGHVFVRNRVVRKRNLSIRVPVNFPCLEISIQRRAVTEEVVGTMAEVTPLWHVGV